MSIGESTISEDAFEGILRDAIVRPAGRSFRGEPARQVELLRRLRTAPAPLSFDELHDHLIEKGLVRAGAGEPAARRKAIRQALAAINDKLGAYFFRAPDIRLLPEMFRVGVVGAESGRPAAFLEDYFGIRKASGVRFFATSAEPAGGLTRELYDLVTEVRPARLSVYAASFSSFLGNPDFRALLEEGARRDDGRLRFLLLDPASPAAQRIESAIADVPLRGGIRARIDQSLRHLQDIRERLDERARTRLEVRLAPAAPLWRFRMVFLPDVLHLRLTVPASPDETLVKLDATSSLYRSLEDVFEEAWRGATPPRTT